MRKLIALTLLAALLLTACSGISISDAKTGPLQTATIAVPAPDADAADVTLRFGASNRFRLQPGASGLVDGTVQYNVDLFKPIVTTSGSGVTIEQRPNDMTVTNNMRNEWELRLSDSIPMTLNVEAGAYKGEYDLGGLRLRNLSVSQGAADSTYDFSEANPDQMDDLTFKSGASSAKLTNLANANAAQMHFDIAAGSYTLDFGGALQRTVGVEVQGGASGLTIRVPSGTPTIVTIKGALNSADVDGFTGIGDRQYANASWDESQPHIAITVDSALGSVKLQSN
ncbi:MAG: hypothetical protein IPO81_12015 [Kouleothrix sp.]|nr:hypothetical protein [Kouleothrix sp.]